LFLEFFAHSNFSQAPENLILTFERVFKFAAAKFFPLKLPKNQSVETLPPAVIYRH
jgi:hypothetical protein